VIGAIAALIALAGVSDNTHINVATSEIPIPDGARVQLECVFWNSDRAIDWMADFFPVQPRQYGGALCVEYPATITNHGVDASAALISQGWALAAMPDAHENRAFTVFERPAEQTSSCDRIVMGGFRRHPFEPGQAMAPHTTVLSFSTAQSVECFLQ